MLATTTYKRTKISQLALPAVFPVQESRNADRRLRYQESRRGPILQNLVPAPDRPLICSRTYTDRKPIAVIMITLGNFPISTAGPRVQESCLDPCQIGRASCREKSVDLGG